MTQTQESVLHYCELKTCKGVWIEAIISSSDDDKECPICYALLREEGITTFTCKHGICRSCEKDVDEKAGCPMCTKEISMKESFSRPIVSSLKEIKLVEHQICLAGVENLNVNKCLIAVGENWSRLIAFIRETQLANKNFLGSIGIESLNLSKFEKEERILDRSSSHATIKTDDGRVQIVFACFFLNLSLRLVVSNRDFEFEAENDYADNVVDWIMTQVNACWVVLPHLINPRHLCHTYVRKFEKVTCTLLLAGLNFCHVEATHKMPMKNEFDNLKKCNFDPDHLRRTYNIMPPLAYEKLRANRASDVNLMNLTRICRNCRG